MDLCMNLLGKMEMSHLPMLARAYFFPRCGSLATGQRAAKMYPSSPPPKKGFIPLALVYITCICHMLHGTGIFTYIWLKFMVNVGEYSSPIEHLGMLCFTEKTKTSKYLCPHVLNEGHQDPGQLSLDLFSHTFCWHKKIQHTLDSKKKRPFF